MSSTANESSSWSKKLSQIDMKQEYGHVKKLLSLQTWQMFMILGLSISGLAAITYTIEAILNIQDQINECLDTDPYKSSRNTEFWIILVLSVIVVIIGSALAWYFRAKDNQHRLIVLSLIVFGVLGILYSISIKINKWSDIIKLSIAWIVFIVFILISWYLNTKSNVKIQNIFAYDV